MTRLWAGRLLAACAGVVLMVAGGVSAAAEPVKVGIMLPFSGTYAALGEAITNGLKMAIEDNGGKLGGREVEYVVVDGEANPANAAENMQKLVSGANVDFVVGPVHSGVAMGMVKVARDEDAILIIPNAGLGVATGALCAPNIFRTSFTNWQPAYPMGEVAMERGFDDVVIMSWRYGAGQEALDGFAESYEAAGGNIMETIYVPFPSVEFQAQLTKIASLKPDAVFVFFAGGGAVKFVKDYAAAGLKDSIQLLGSGFLTDGTLEAQGEAAEGVLTTLHYSTELENPVNQRFIEEYEARYDMAADIYAVQGYDTGQLLVQAMAEVGGDTEDQDALIAAMENVTIESPRGDFTFSAAHNPVQDIYLREVVDGKNKVIGVAAEDLADPARGCRMAQ